ncbi:MAG: DNA repair protein RecO [Pyrinomonadaceae bacterium]
MGLVDTEALVLRTYNLAEADKIVLCFCRSSGMIRGVAKGARRLKNRFGAALEPFTILRITYYERENRELVTLSHAEILKSHFNLSQNSEIVAALAYLSELLIEFSPPHEPNEKLYRMAVACADAMAAVPLETESITRYFETWILKLGGFLPDLRKCADCGVHFDETEGAFLNAEAKPRCYRCSRGTGTALSNEARQHWLSTQKLGPVEFARSADTLGLAAKTQLASFTQQMLVSILNRRPRGMPAQ